MRTVLNWLKEHEQKNKFLFTIARFIVAAVVMYFGALYAMVYIAKIQFERTGFGIDRHADLYVIAGYAAGFAVSLIVPAVIWRFVLPKQIGRWWWIAVVVGIVGAGILFGISI